MSCNHDGRGRVPPGTALNRHDARPERRYIWSLSARRSTGTALDRHVAGRRRGGADAQMYTASPGAEKSTCMLARVRQRGQPRQMYTASSGAEMSTCMLALVRGRPRQMYTASSSAEMSTCMLALVRQRGQRRQMYTASSSAEMSTCMLALTRSAAAPLVTHVAGDYGRQDEHKQGAHDELLSPAHLQTSLSAERVHFGRGREAQPREEEGAPVSKMGRRDEHLHAGARRNLARKRAHL